MVLLFEDSSNSTLANLYKLHRFSDSVKLRYSSGSGSLLRTVVNIQLEFPNDICVVFVDVAPDNDECLREYSKLIVYAQNFIGSVFGLFCARG